MISSRDAFPFSIFVRKKEHRISVSSLEVFQKECADLLNRGFDVIFIDINDNLVVFEGKNQGKVERHSVQLLVSDRSTDVGKIIGELKASPPINSH